MKFKICVLLLLLVAIPQINADQKIGFFSSQMIREKLPDAKLANQRVQSMEEEWKRELKSLEEKEKSLQEEMRKNRLIWSDIERQKYERELTALQKQQQEYSRAKFGSQEGNEYDKVVKEVFTPVEEKIFAAVQEVASREHYDMIWDLSIQPLAYVNFKYDITLKVLKLLGVDVAKEEAEQEKKIANDPRNDEERKQQESQGTRRRSRTAPSKSPDSTNSNQNIQPIKK